MWVGDVLQSNDMVKHSAGILSYGSSSAIVNSTNGAMLANGEVVTWWRVCVGDGASTSEKNKTIILR
jgi:hypothetical protein